MSLIKSNSSLIGFNDYHVYGSNRYEFLQYVQSLSLNIDTNRIEQKSIGEEFAENHQYVFPDVSLDINYIQQNTFFNELLFGFKLDNDINQSSFYELINQLLSINY